MKQLSMRVCLLLSIGACACSSSPTSAGFGGDAGSGAGCTSDSDCKGSRVCKSGECVEGVTDSGTPPPPPPPADAGPVCSTPGKSCATSLDCCPPGAGASKGAVCLTDDYVCHAKCTTDGECNSGCCAPLKGLSYGACAAKSYCETAGVGDSCASGSSCQSGLLCAGGTNGWCTHGCSDSSDCNGSYGGKNKYGHYNWCMKTSGGANDCFPGCSTDADCSWYPGTTCKTGSTTVGVSVGVCST